MRNIISIFESVDYRKLYSYRFAYYMAVSFSLLIITWFFNYQLGISGIFLYLIIFLILSELLARSQMKEIIAGNNYSIFKFSLLPLLIILGAILLSSLSASNIVLMDFSINEENLGTAHGKVEKKYDQSNEVKISDNNRSYEIYLDYPQNNLTNREVYIPEDNFVEIKYLKTNKKIPSTQDYLLLAYSVKDNDKEYLSYTSSIKYFKNFQQKAIRYIVISTVLYFLSTILVFITYFQLSKKIILVGMIVF